MILYTFLTICLIVGFITIVVYTVKFLKFIFQKVFFTFNNLYIKSTPKKPKKHKPIKHKYSEYINACWDEIK